MKVAVFISSHICYKGQLTLLSRALQSVLSQTIIPHVYISLSFADEIVEMKAAKKDIKSTGRAWKVHSKQRFQLQHLEYLTNKYADQYDMILFLDDDDTYNTNRVACMCEAFTACRRLNRLHGPKKICVREYTDKEDVPEYWAYGVQPSILQDFFKEIRSRKLLIYIWNKMGDMVLRSYLRFKDIHVIGIRQRHMLYIYNKNNPNGVCNSQRSHKNPKNFKIHQLEQITVWAGVAYNEGIFSVEELVKRVKKTVLGPHKESYYPSIIKLCLSAQKLIDYYNEIWV